MPYTDSQKKYYNTKPSIQQIYTTITFSNLIAGDVRIIASDENGPYKPMMFNVNGGFREFLPVAAEAPPVSTQDPLSNDVGTLKLGRVALEMSEYLEEISMNATRFDQKVISVNLSVYENPISEPVYSIDVFAGQDGISINESDVIVKLQYSNPAKNRYAPFYSPEDFIALRYQS